MLGLSESLPRLAAFFSDMDTNGDGTISLVEFLDKADLDRTPFIERAFGIMDSDGTGELDFREWVIAMWHFATLGHDDLAGFMFDLYDLDGSDGVSVSELERALKDAYGNKAAGRNVQKILVKAAKRDGSMSRKEFVETIKSKSEMLYPAVQAQTQVRRVLLGERFWDARQAERGRSMDPAMRPARYRQLVTKLMELDLTARAYTTKNKAGAKVAPTTATGAAAPATTVK
jgi:serine/threonine-protein phosphatase 2B regulatory subunit